MKAEGRSIAPVRPSSSVKPRTSRRLPTIEPVSEARTTSVRPSFTATKAMISSGALPNDAFRNPPMHGLVRRARWSVASPISHESGMRAGGEHEEGHVSDAAEVIEDDDHRLEEQQGCENEGAARDERTFS
jgi:hypothetical protein